MLNHNPMKTKGIFWVAFACSLLPVVTSNADDQFVTRNGHTEPLVPVHHLKGDKLVPSSSMEAEEDIGIRSHTNHVLFFPNSSQLKADAARSYYVAETPQAIRQVYNLPSTGGSGAIAIIDAYHYPTALADFNKFSQTYALPVESSTNATAAGNQVFQVVYASGKQPVTDGGWAEETALDIEWAHAMAPNAKIILVEAASDSFSDLLAAVAKANTIAGVKEVSMSWGGSEWRSETAYDSYFTQSGIVYVASSGDVGGIVSWPACSPNVIAVGGSDIVRDANGAFTKETGWIDAGGGASRYEARPAWQSKISSIVGSRRGTPDVSFDADPDSGVYVYDSTPYEGMSGWLIFGGTSVGAPSFAGILNAAATARGSFSLNSAAELTSIYANLGNAANFRDVSQGKSVVYPAVVGWDYVTGVGSALGLIGK